MLVQKKAAEIRAWKLGGGSEKEKEMMAKKAIVLKEDGSYELFSQEAAGKTGQRAEAGDYFKVDSAGYPYPNKKAEFEATHKCIEADLYLQKTPVLFAWTAEQPINEAMQYLFDTGLVVRHENEPEYFFTAFLWGTKEAAAKDSVIVFYDIQKDGSGKIIDIDFNFVERNEFNKTYNIISME